MNKSQFFINTVLRKILEQNPTICINDVELFSEIYYPLAKLELEMTENTFEEFEMIPLTISKYVKYGIYDSAKIAGLMGLTKNYVEKNFNLLKGYGYIDQNNKITDLGNEAINREKKISYNNVKQVFKADALTGDLINLGEQPADSDLQESIKTSFYVPHLMHIDGIDAEELEMNIMSKELTQYKEYKEEILNANVEEIKSMKCLGLEYFKAYMLKLRSFKRPIVFVYKVNKHSTKYNDKFIWAPLRIPRGFNISDYDEEIKIYPDKSQKYIDCLYDLMRDYVAKLSDEAVLEHVNRLNSFNQSEIEIRRDNTVSNTLQPISVIIKEKAFNEWNWFVFYFLNECGKERGYLVTKSGMRGTMFYFTTECDRILQAASRFQNLTSNNNTKKVMEFFFGRLSKKGSVDWGDFDIVEAEFIEEQEDIKDESENQ